MSWFALATAVLWVFAGVEYTLQQNWRMVIVSLCYAAATGALVGAK